MIPKRSGEKKKEPDVQGFVIEDSPCVWMKAGVVNFKLCGHDYDCLNCSFDRAMRLAWEHEPITENNGRERN